MGRGCGYISCTALVVVVLTSGCTESTGPVTSDAGPPGGGSSQDGGMDASSGMDAGDAGDAGDAAQTPDAGSVDAGPPDSGPIDFGMPGLDARPVNDSCFAPLRGRPMPDQLSETGCFTKTQPPQPSSALIPFDLNAPLWSDHAHKDRWMALPEGTMLQVLPDGDVVFPEGTVLSKTFVLEGRKLETRFLMFQAADPDGFDGGMPMDAGWVGVAYKWRDDQQDADLIGVGEDGVSFDVPGPTGMLQTWTIPVANCLNCHNAAVGRSIGIELGQLNREMKYPRTGRTQNQVHTWNAIGLFSEPLGDNRDWPLLMPYDDGTPSGANPEATPEQRARSYLHANCAFCHRRPTMAGGPDGPGINEDFRVTTRLADMKSCDVSTTQPERYGLGEKLLVPGMPASSSMLQRMQDPTPEGEDKQNGGLYDRARMPPVGTTLVHPLGINIVSSWITQLTECPP